uniref:Phospholipase A2 receptor 1 n=1 Tax=Poecilia mexicana TaxID=48701 RepID=A0A3B3XG56_9TELE
FMISTAPQFLSVLALIYGLSENVALSLLPLPPGKGLFVLESVTLKRCVTVNGSNVVLDDCERPTRRMLWKWVSRHRLFNLGSSMCLGLNASDATQPLGMFECDATHLVLWWRCHGNMLYGASEWKVTVAGRLVVAKKNIYHEWQRHKIHTLLGNAHGYSCVFPFNYNNKWYAECTTEGREDNLHWCATTDRYDRSERWGFCPVKASSCDHFWESNQELGACYQFNLYTILTWSQALATCRAQGGDLLSITSLAEHRYIRGGHHRLANVGAMVWIGLNHLKDGYGWKWSDGAPLSLVNFTAETNMPCGVYNSAYGAHWQSLSCESALPYICKKTPNNTSTVEPLENWQYIPTECADGWWPHNGFCYHVLAEKESGSWKESSRACGSLGAKLISLRSLSEVEMLLNLLANRKSVRQQTCCILSDNICVSKCVEWSDGSPVTLTLWDQYQPVPNLTDSSLCVKMETEVRRGALRQSYAVCCCPCQISSLPSDTERQLGWKRHGQSCYTVTSHEQTFEDAALGYYCMASLLTVENRFEQAFVNSLLSANGTNSSMNYWIGLKDQEKKGEYRWLPHNGSSLPLTFSNWNKHQPVSAGGCVVMSGGPALGHWEVKDCKSHKALSVCKMSSGHSDAGLPERHIDAYAPCPPGWESHSGLLHCFKVFHDEKVLMKRSWVEADFFCQALGAQLASFQHYEEQVFVKHLLSTMFEGTEGRWFWVGLNKRDPDHPGAWEWSDGSPIVTSFIEDKNEEDDRRDCAVYSDLTDNMMPRPCDTKHEWICKLSRGKRAHTFSLHAVCTIYKHTSVPPGLVNFVSRSHLLSIHSREESQFIKERLRRVSGRVSPCLQQVNAGRQVWPFIFKWQRPVVRFHLDVAGKWSVKKCSELHGYVCKRRTVSVVETPQEPHYIGACPEKWLYFGHKCLLLHLPGSPNEGKSWKDAQSICSLFQGSLVAIEDEIEQAYITMLLQGSSVGVWIGLRDEDTMKWTNGKPVSYTNWSPQDDWLSGAADEPLCTVLSNNHNFHLTGKWYDEKCSESGYGFVCQKPQDTSKPPTHSYHHPLPDNIEYRSSTYKVVSGNMSWYDAMHMCIANDSELVSITDAYHQAFLTVLVNRLDGPHWIGLYSQDSGINYKWSDGSDTVYTHWDAADDDDDNFVTGECVYIDVNGGWRRADCETPLPGALCHVPLPSHKPFVSNEMSCPHTWVKFGRGCYDFEPVVEKLTFEESRTRCKQKVNTSDILTIESETENRFVLEQLWSSGSLHRTIWLGMYFNIDTDSMAWVDGSPTDYTNWADKGPDTKQLTADTCVTTRVMDGVWHLSTCGGQLGFICKTVSDLPQCLHHGIIPAAVVVAVLIFALLAGAMWLLYKRNPARFRGFPSLGSAYYRQTNSQATESDGNVLITDLEAHSGE